MLDTGELSQAVQLIFEVLFILLRGFREVVLSEAPDNLLVFRDPRVILYIFLCKSHQWC